MLTNKKNAMDELIRPILRLQSLILSFIATRLPKADNQSASEDSPEFAEPREVSIGLVTESGWVGGPPPLSPKWRKRSAIPGVANIRTIVPNTSSNSIRSPHLIAHLDGRYKASTTLLGGCEDSFLENRAQFAVWSGFEASFEDRRQTGRFIDALEMLFVTRRSSTLD
jgi:hypothetical protein